MFHKNEGVKLRKRKTCDPENNTSNTGRKQRNSWDGERAHSLVEFLAGSLPRKVETSGRSGCKGGVWTAGGITDRLPNGFL